MDPPPARLPLKRRAVSAQQTNTALSQSFSSQVSPSPFTSSSLHSQGGVEAQSPRPKSQTVSIEWKDDSISRHTSTLQIGVAECVETKTVTTTTTTKRSYPPLLIRHQSLDNLDAKEYPLASRPTPSELLSFSYDIDPLNDDRLVLPNQIDCAKEVHRQKLDLSKS
jgi:F-box and WD-40 domain protein CDC4